MFNKPGLWIHQKATGIICSVHPPPSLLKPKSWYAFYHPTESRRPSWPRHFSNSKQPIPKPLWRHRFCSKHQTAQAACSEIQS